MIAASSKQTGQMKITLKTHYFSKENKQSGVKAEVIVNLAEFAVFALNVTKGSVSEIHLILDSIARHKGHTKKL